MTHLVEVTDGRDVPVVTKYADGVVVSEVRKPGHFWLTATAPAGHRVYLRGPFTGSDNPSASERAALAHRQALDGYPRVVEHGGLIWACCVSSIGPVCGHRQ